MLTELNTYQDKLVKYSNKLGMDLKAPQTESPVQTDIIENKNFRSSEVVITVEDPLVESAQNECRRSIEQLYKRELPIISYLTYPYKNYIPQDEIIGCYDIVFCKALKDFDKSRGVKFSWYLLFLVEKDIQKEIPKFAEIYIPPKIRTMAFKVSCYLYYTQHITWPTDEDIRYGLLQFNYKETYFNNIKEAIPLVKYQHVIKDKKAESDDFILNNLNEDFCDVHEQWVEREIQSAEIKTAKLHSLLDEAITLYVKPKDRKEIKLLINAYMYSDISREGYIKGLSHLFDCSGSNVSNKYNNLFAMLKEFFNCKGISLEDLL